MNFCRNFWTSILKFSYLIIMFCAEDGFASILFQAYHWIVLHAY